MRIPLTWIGKDVGDALAIHFVPFMLNSKEWHLKQIVRSENVLCPLSNQACQMCATRRGGGRRAAFPSLGLGTPLRQDSWI